MGGAPQEGVFLPSAVPGTQDSQPLDRALLCSAEVQSQIKPLAWRARLPSYQRGAGLSCQAQLLNCFQYCPGAAEKKKGNDGWEGKVRLGNHKP